MKGTISKSKLSNVPPIIKYTKKKKKKKNTKIGIYQSANQKPHFPQFVFELDPHNPQWSRHFVDPAFSTKKARLVFLFKTKKPFLENGLESPLIFVFILKGKTK